MRDLELLKVQGLSSLAHSLANHLCLFRGFQYE